MQPQPVPSPEDAEGRLLNLKAEKMKIYQSAKPTKRRSGKEARYLSLRGNGKFGNVTRTGWEPCNLGEKKKAAIADAINHPDTDRVWRVGTKVFRLTLNGKTEQVC